MKRYLSLLILFFEIAAITSLHAIKINQKIGEHDTKMPGKNSANLSARIPAPSQPAYTPFTLVSLK
jgi:hypothetical protein